MKIAGSFLKINNDKEKIKTLNKVCDNIHIDVMDGIFTKKATIPFENMQSINEIITKPKDVHLMVENIYEYIDLYKNLKPDYITFHYEISKNHEKIINYIKSLGIKAGIAINPDTNVNSIINYLNKLDLVLVMSVFPGAGGQTFIDITDKIDYLKDYREKNNLSFIIEVDGGINDITINQVKDADLIVVGSYITDSDDYQTQIKKIRGIKWKKALP